MPIRLLPFVAQAKAAPLTRPFSPGSRVPHQPICGVAPGIRYARKSLCAFHRISTGAHPSHGTSRIRFFDVGRYRMKSKATLPARSDVTVFSLTHT